MKKKLCVPMLCIAAFAMLVPSTALAAQPCENNPKINPTANTGEPGAVIDVSTQGVQAAQATPVYEWSQVEGEPGVLTPKNNAKGATFVIPVVTDPAKAAIKIRLSVTNCGFTRDAFAIINAQVVSSNQPPSAVASVSPETVGESGSFSLDARNSTDPDGGTLTYRWEQVDHTLDFPIAGLPATTALVSNLVAPSHVPLAGVTITFRLTVSDPAGLRDIEEKTLAVSWVNDPPVPRAQVVVFDAAGEEHAYACPEETPVEVDEGDEFILDGSASTDDVPTGMMFLWSQSEGGPAIEDGMPEANIIPEVAITAPALKPLLGDVMDFRLKVTDAQGLSAFSESCSVRVRDITIPAIEVPADLIAEASGPDGATVSYAVRAHDNKDGELTPTCSLPSGSLFPLGSTTVTCTATDAAGNAATESFTVTVRDTTAPTLVLPDDITWEADTFGGARVVFQVSANDAVDGPLTPICTALASPGTTTVASGDLFPVTTTTVTCTAADAHGNQVEGSFTITVTDTTPPVLASLPDIRMEADRLHGALVAFPILPSATDTVDGPVEPICSAQFSPGVRDVESGDFFPVGSTTVTCTATDAAGNSASESFVVTVTDTTPPELFLSDLTAEGNTQGGAFVEFLVPPSAYDTVDGSIAPTCSARSGDKFPVGSTTVTCSASDAAGNQAEASFTVTVRDTTAPTLTVPENQTVEGNALHGATVPFTAPAASDIVDGAIAPVCSAQPGAFFPLGISTVTCSATDAAGNHVQRSFTVTVVDTTAPTLHLPANIEASATSSSGALVTFTATAADVVAGDVSVRCSPTSGTLFAPGITTVSCTATDTNGNSASGEFSVTVRFALLGFFQPVDNASTGLLNTVKGGSTVPMKFKVQGANGVEITDVSAIDLARTGAVSVPCSAMQAEAAIEVTATGGTSLRYDTVGQQFIFNWQTARTAGACFRFELTLKDGNKQTANFKLK